MITGIEQSGFMSNVLKKMRYCIALVVASSQVVTVGLAQVDISDSGAGQRELTFSLPQDIKLVAVDEGWAVVCDGQAGSLPSGAPDLPVFSEILALQPGESLEAVTVTAVYEVVTQNVSVVAVSVRETVALDPGQSRTRTVRRKDRVIYDSDGFWPAQQVSINEVWQGSRKLARLELRPVQYNPATGTVRVCRSMKVVLRTVLSRDEEGPRGPIRRRPPSSGVGDAS